MKKLIIAMIAFALILCLAGCEISNTSTNTSSTNNSKERFASDIYIWTDKETGVQYIVYSDDSKNTGGITPRLNADGTLYTEDGK
jgi:maltose-binding protein MalE